MSATLGVRRLTYVAVNTKAIDMSDASMLQQSI